MNNIEVDEVQLMASNPTSVVVKHPSGSAWMLHTPSTSYAIALDKNGVLVQRYWGPRLDDASLDTLLRDYRERWNSSFERPAEFEEQLPVDGGPRWGLPALQARLGDGVRTLDLEFEGAEAGEDFLVIGLRDGIARVRVRLHYRVHALDDLVDRWVEVINDAGDELRLLRFDSGSWLIPELAGYRVSTSHGYWGGETQLSRLPLPRGEYRIGSRQGIVGHVANPWMMIDAGEASEDAGEVWLVALAWSGSWHLTAQHRAEGIASITGGWSQEGVEHRVPAHGSLTSPVASGCYANGGFGGMSRIWHDVIRRRILPAGRELRPVLYNSWEATEFDIDLATEIDLAEHAAALGVELFVVDDGWFHGRVDDHAGLGDWWPDEIKFPDGLTPLSDRVHELGMRFGIWVEPEMVNVRSELYAAHPDWLQRWPGREGTEIRHQRVLNFGLPAVRDHITNLLDDLVTQNGIDFIKWDMNRPFTDPGHTADLQHSDDLWRTHTDGVYEVMDEVRRRHPRLRLEACASGGARVDLGVFQRVEQVWTSDNTDALDRQTIQHGYSQLYPANTMAAWVTDHTNIVSRRTIPLEYRFHVAMTGALGLGADIRTWTEQERATARRLIETYKDVRETVQLGTQYRLGGRPGTEQSAIQYVDATTTVLFAYDPHRSLSTAPRRIRLKGLEATARYQDADSGAVYSGAFLMGQGIKANRDENDRGWDNVRFSNRDYISSLTILRRVGCS